MTLAIAGVLLSLATLITLAYRGMPVIFAAPIASTVAVLFSGAPILASYTEVFMPAMGGFIGSFFPVFLLGAIFGVLMTVTGYAAAIAKAVVSVVGSRSAVAATVITSALMTYGGISVFVVVFVMYPLAREIFRAADFPRRLIPAAIGLGAGTFTLTALPGTPAIQNIIPGQFFGTNAYAAPGVGLLGGTAILILGLLYLERRKRSMVIAGEHFDSPESAPATSGSSDADSPRKGQNESLVAPNKLFPFLPLLAVVLVNFSCTLLIFPALEWSSLEDERFGGITLDDRAGLWAVMVAILSGIIVLVALNYQHAATIKDSIVDGMKGSLLPAFSVASEVAYGAVIASLAAFALIRDSVLDVGFNALWTSVIANNVTAGITGSSSGGMTIALNALGAELQDQAATEGISMEAMHRLTVMAAGGLDSLPHSGAVITILLVCGLTHRQSYRDLGVVTIVLPLSVTVGLVTLVTAVGTF
ncbi:GntP family permease [Nesterenkonia sp. CL21]|uniref:GntP family permease n=1 Tax=Nesterenkonia sp. CL21 TaxID=3064894 RepID=UPI0028790790|nr:GntP family permease [Nesterenkonia sp. CL21]MDS2174110.1 GntP family permease [Nesterenkonia sp. CL21]